MSLYQQETTYYRDNGSDSGERKTYELIPEGKYYAHVSDVEKKIEDKDINGRGDRDGQLHLADLINVTYKIAEGEFKDRLVWSNAIWLFKNPPNESYTANPEGNMRYSIFLEAVKYPLQMKEIEDSEGTMIKVKELPVELDTSQVVGMPVEIEVKHREYEKDGETKKVANESRVSPWSEGKQIENDDDLPF